MNSNNKKKNDLLGEPFGTASAKLRKSLLFSLLIKLEENTCFQCGKQIETVGDLSIEHKLPWMSADNPIDAFFDLDNIAFSHLKCNVMASNRVIPHHNTRGERSGMSKLTSSEVSEIKELVRQGQSDVSIAKKYNIAPPTVRDIKSGRTWSYK